MFGWLEHDFMRTAFLAVVFSMPMFGILGTMIVNNRMAFLSDAIGHSALTGIAIGALIGLQQPLPAMIGFALLLAAGISVIKNKSANSTDTVIGVFSSTAVTLGIFILSAIGGFQKYTAYLIGDLLSITPAEVLMLVIVLVVVLVFWIFLFNKLMASSVNRSLAESRGIRTRFLELGFTLLTAVVVMVAIRWVGILIINAMLVVPAAAARNISPNMRAYHAWSIGIALISGLCGLVISYYWNTATGATIVLVAAVFYLGSLLFRIKQI